MPVYQEEPRTLHATRGTADGITGSVPSFLNISYNAAVSTNHLTTMHKCTTCGRAFTRRDHLLRHSSRCTPKPFACDVCRSSFGRKRDIDHHKRTVRCGGPPQPGPSASKRRRIALNEDPLTPPPVEHAANDNLSRNLRDFVHENWASVRTHVVNGPVQTRYNHRLTSLDTRDLQEPLFVLFDQQKTAFKVNVSSALC